MQSVYLDNNATTRPCDEVVAAMRESIESLWQNPSSVHRAGQGVRARVELARHAIASLLGCRDRDVIFTGSGTESTNLAIRGSLALLPDRPVLVTAATEHSAVRELAESLANRGTEVVWLPAAGDGCVDVDALSELLKARADEIALVSVMWANNETGTIQPVESIGSLCREHGVRFHTDATQWIGKNETDVQAMPIDLLTCSAHKFHGPKGIGALYVRRGLRVDRQIVGGPQEMERRAGTENVPGILGFGAAAAAAQAWMATDGRATIQALRDRLEASLIGAIPDTTINGGAAARLWNTTNVGFAGVEAEAILLLLSERGVCASAGAACSSGSLDPSPVLRAMGVPETIAHGSIRLSLSRETTSEEIDRACEVLPEVVAKLRRS